VDNIKTELGELGWDVMDWRALENTVMNLRVPYIVGKLSSNCTTGGFSRRTQLHGVSHPTSDEHLG
jgi:hypothetical protein